MNNTGKEGTPIVDTYVTPLVLSGIGVIAMVLIITTFFFIFWWQYLRLHRDQTINNTASGSPVKNNGVDEDILKRIPLITYNKRWQIEPECSICLGELKDGEVLRLLPACNHAFHVPCIDEWFKEHTNCPNCRSLITCEGDKPADVLYSQEIDDHWIRVVTHGYDDDHNNNNNRDTDNGDDDVSNSSNSTNSRLERLKHPSSVPLCDMKNKQCSFGRKLKRSFSMDQSYLCVAVTIQQRDHSVHHQEREASASSSSSNSKGIMMMNHYKSRSLSMKHIDQMSRVLVRPPSQFRNGSFG
ncbi:hypothetical protein HN51_021562 [Arachis hypogaea]|uniref:uncharacterized protein n=1 Tax=Arachis hypogaea TaxID=3818 RepID=UPI000DEC507B|nr:RING-H2 finger protein ATL17-like [Arachis hypogaea]QHO52664.1 RING-H2 finger protein [Arachis hypogaea]